MLLAFIVIIVTYCSFIGWGWILSQLFHFSNMPGQGLLAAWGMAFAAICGGFLNLFKLISPLTVTLFLITGIVLFFILLYRKWKNIKDWFISKKPSKGQDYLYLGLIVLLVVCILFIFLQANGHSFNEHDDFHAYLVYPYRMLQTGSLGLEPFNERRLGVYGGLSFLQAIIMGSFDIHRPHYMETGLSWLIIIVLILGYCKKSLEHIFFFILLALGLHFIQIPSANISSLLSGIALFLALFMSHEFMQKERMILRVFFLSLLVAGICSLKSSFIPASGLILFLFIMLAKEKHVSLKLRIQETLLIGLVSLCLLLPWMVAMQQSNATLMYPVLGNGYHGSAYSSFPHNSCGSWNYTNLRKGLRYLCLQTPFLLSVLLLGLSLFKKGIHALQFRLNFSVFFGGWPLVYIFYIMSGGIARYNFPISFAIILFQLVDFFNDQDIVQKRAAIFKEIGINLLVLFISFIAIYATFGWIKWKQQINCISHPQSAWSKKHVQQIRKAQQTIPKGAVLLARVSRPFLLDFSRNQVFTVDWPGGSGPKPGLPCFGNVKKLVNYLKKNKIRYVMYSYGDESGHSRKKYIKRLRLPDWDYYGRVKKLAQYSFGFQYMLLKLAKQYKNVYRDQLYVVIDLEG